MSSNNNKRAFKLAEFTAHAPSNVNCVTIGRKSQRIAATGGEDKKVNLWTLTKPTCIMSLSGHTSPVHSLSFSTNEDKIASGSFSGSIKVWDLESNRLICNLVGHKSNVSCSEFHTHSEYLASGSVDSHVRLWDLRRKGCIYTYKGHNGAINSLKFSPDSKWIASASEDCSIKIWDLKAGKLLTELKGHMGSVNSLEFHPNEFLLASGSADRTVKFWDLEKMELVTTSPTQTLSSIKCISFDPNGQCLFAGSQDYLHTFTWEPSKCYDSVYCQWKQVNEIIFNTNNKLIGASLSQQNISFFAVDLTQVAPFGTPPSPPDKQQNSNYPSSTNSSYQQQPTSQPVQHLKPLSSSTRRNFSHHQQMEKPIEQNNETDFQQQSQQPNENDDDSSTGNICNEDEYNKIFRPKNEIKRLKQPQSPPVISNHVPITHAALKRETSPPPPSKSVYTPRPNILAHQPISIPQPQLKSPIVEKIPQPHVHQSIPTKEMLDKKINDNNQFGVNMNDFMPKEENISKIEALDLVSSIDTGHDSIMKSIRIRLKNIQNIRSIWTNGNIKLALDTAVSMDDITVLADILNQINQTAAIWTLDICSILLPTIKKLIDSKYEEHVQVGCDSSKIILKTFGKLIKANIAPPSSVGVDLSREERQRKCTHCYDYLTAIILAIDKKQNVASPKVAASFREINVLMKTLD